MSANDGMAFAQGCVSLRAFVAVVDAGAGRDFFRLGGVRSAIWSNATQEDTEKDRAAAERVL